MKISKKVLRLYFIQVSAFLAASLSMYIPGMDLLCCLFFLIIVCMETRLNTALSTWQILLIAILWQGPAILLALYTLLGLQIWSLNDYAIFLLQFWGAPMLSLWSLFQISIPLEYPLYYYLVVMTPICLAVFYFLAGTKLNTLKINKSVGGFQ